MHGFTSPNPKTPYIKMVTRDGLQSLLEQYRYAYQHSVDTKPHVIRSAIVGDFIALVPVEVFHLMLEYFPVKGVSNVSEETAFLVDAGWQRYPVHMPPGYENPHIRL
jgi:hypothetical protein